MASDPEVVPRRASCENLQIDDARCCLGRPDGGVSTELSPYFYPPAQPYTKPDSAGPNFAASVSSVIICYHLRCPVLSGFMLLGT